MVAQWRVGFRDRLFRSKCIHIGRKQLAYVRRLVGLYHAYYRALCARSTCRRFAASISPPATIDGCRRYLHRLAHLCPRLCRQLLAISLSNTHTHVLALNNTIDIIRLRIQTHTRVSESRSAHTESRPNNTPTVVLSECE